MFQSSLLSGIVPFVGGTCQKRNFRRKAVLPQAKFKASHVLCAAAAVLASKILSATVAEKKQQYVMNHAHTHLFRLQIVADCIHQRNSYIRHNMYCTGSFVAHQPNKFIVILDPCRLNRQVSIIACNMQRDTLKCCLENSNFLIVGLAAPEATSFLICWQFSPSLCAYHLRPLIVHFVVQLCFRRFYCIENCGKR